ncbi:hypothetical protein AB1L30_14065 [Bremerella sp. JC817]|uniref:hypothetical protein n=1 Tax=Bremerella sp. JC817 TaxID=3231756 RepID=UPI0034594851
MPFRNHPFSYVGPAEIAADARQSDPGFPIVTPVDLASWRSSQAAEIDAEGNLTATYTIGLDDRLRLASRRSEHVACAAGGPVWGAGEVTFDASGKVVAISNYSTGFCPEAKWSWPRCQQVLDQIGLPHPGKFTTEVIFRRCPACHERNVVKDDYYACDLCGCALPAIWNFG